MHLGYEIKRKHHFNLKSYTTRKYTKKGKEAFIKEFKDQDWTPMEPIIGSSARNDFFQGVVESLVDKHFPIKKFIIKDTDDPWITDWIRKKIKKRQLEFKRSGRSFKWKELRDEIREDIKKEKIKYYERECEKLIGGTRLHYTALRNLSVQLQLSLGVYWIYSQNYQNIIVSRN